MALGNGAPDVFTSISGIGSGDFDIVIGELLGASVFISTVILGTVILCADVEVDRSSFLRDILVYIIASVGIMLTVMDGSINLFESLMFLVLYVMYVFVVLVGSWWTRKQQEAVREAEKANNIYHELPNAASEDPNAHMYTRSSSHFDPTMDNPHVQSDIQFLTDDERGEAALAGLTWDGSAHPVSKLIVVLEYPFSLLRWLSIPSATADWDAKRRFLAACSPACAGAVIALDVKGWDAFASVSSTDWALAASAALLSFLAIYFTSNNHSRPPYHFLLVVLAFVSTVGWLNLLANECVSVAQSLGLINNISSSIMGLTILAWGNSVGDWVADVAVAKAGNTKMAVATCFGSPLLNDIVGLGLALTMTCLNTEKSVQTPLDDKVKLGYTFLFISLFSSVSCFSCSSYRPPKSFALYLIVLYVVFLVLSILEATGSISLPF